MGDPNALVQTILTTVPSCIAAAVIDLNSGEALAIKTTGSHPSDLLELVAAAVQDVFDGPNIRKIEDGFRTHRGVHTSERYAQQITIEGHPQAPKHVFVRLSGSQDIVLAAVTRADNLAMAKREMGRLAMKEVL